jgi:3-methyladenine DNA glycosylase AlkD
MAARSSRAPRPQDARGHRPQRRSGADGIAAEVASILSALRRLGKAERRRVAAWYFPSRLATYGVSTPELRGVTRTWSRALRDRSARDVLRLARGLVAARVTEARAAAYVILERHAAAMAALDAAEIKALGRGNDNWGSTDAFAVLVAGVAWREGRIADAEVARWSRSRDRWWRRTALVATVSLNLRARGGSGDARRTLGVCKSLLADRDDMVVKGLSWALRALAVRDPAAVHAFVARHRAQIAPRVLREVANKLSTGRKNP